MYIALYNEDLKHITNIDGISYDLTKRVYDLDSFSATGMTTDEIKNAKVLVLCDDYGNLEYSSFVDNVKLEDNKVTIKGLDFKSLWQQEILVDYTKPNSFDSGLGKIFNKVSELVFKLEDKTLNKIPVEVIVPSDDTSTEMLGNYQNTYFIKDAYKFLKLYLKYYEYNIVSTFDIVNNKIVFSFVKNNTEITINLKDFFYELTTSSTTTNKTVATIKYSPISEDENGNEVITPRPATIATSYYYLNKNNDIVESDALGDIEGRIYPVVTKYYEDEYLANAQYNAIYELANSRYVDNIVIDNIAVIDPIDFNNYEIYTKVQLYQDGIYYKSLPISEKNIKLDSSGKKIKVKLGFKKILLTEIIKANSKGG